MITYFKVTRDDVTTGVLCRIKDDAGERTELFGTGRLAWGHVPDDVFEGSRVELEEITPGEAGKITDELRRAAAAEQ